MAAQWAYWYFGLSATILEGNLNLGQYVSLVQIVLNWNQVYNMWMQLRYQNGEKSPLFACDVVYGPLATYPHA